MWTNADTAGPVFAAAVGATVLSAAVLMAEPIKPGPRGDVAAVTEADVSAGVPLEEVNDPGRTLSRATVQTSKGEKVGEVRGVEIGRDGIPKAVKVSTTGFLGLGTLTKSINASDLIYVRHRHVLVSRLTKAEINALPPGKKRRS